MPMMLSAQRHVRTSHNERLIQDSKVAKEEFIWEDASMKNLFDNSYGYVIFPNVGKGALGLGAGAGSGIVYEKGKMIGKAKMKQLNVGLQIGGQAYREVIFFKNRAALNRFRDDNFEFSRRTSAVLVKDGTASNPKYRDGVLIFTQEKSGLMYEVSIGGQRFDYASF